MTGNVLEVVGSNPDFAPCFDVFTAVSAGFQEASGSRQVRGARGCAGASMLGPSARLQGTRRPGGALLCRTLHELRTNALELPGTGALLVC